VGNIGTNSSAGRTTEFDKNLKDFSLFIFRPLCFGTRRHPAEHLL